MILLYSRFNIRRDLKKKIFFERAFTWVNGIKDAQDLFKNLTWDGEPSRSIRVGKNCLEYEIDEELDIVAFRFRITDRIGELWTTDFVLNERQCEFQIRLSREKNMVTADYSSQFRLPYFLRKLIEDGWGGMDRDLPVIDQPVFINEYNISVIADLMNGKTEYTMPVIYVSHLFDCDGYALDVYELAKDMGGCAHVLVEETSGLSGKLRQLTGDRNAYNGAVDVFYGKDHLPYVPSVNRTANQFRYMISQAVYRRLAMLNIDDEQSLTSIRIKNRIRTIQSEKDSQYEILQLEAEGLREKYDQEAEILAMALDENREYEKRINELEARNQALLAALNRKMDGRDRGITLTYTENEFYDDEIKTIVLKCLQRECRRAGDEEQTWRHYHVLKDIVDRNEVSDARENLKANLMRIFRKSRLKSQDWKDLNDLGFVISEGGHDKAKFHGDDRYLLTIACTPGDHREGENMAHSAVNLILGKE